jgi:ribonuclease D
VRLPPFKFVQTPREWQACLESIQAEPRLAIDLEANSLYAYRETVCLIQISIPGQDYIIDPMAGLDLGGLGEIIKDGSIGKVFHAAEYDLILLKRQYDWVLHNLFDTMWAVRILGYERCGLANILADFYGVKLNKRHQKANWSKRPLSESMLAYAQMDTHFLLALRERLSSELEAAGCLEEAQEIFVEQSQIQLNTNGFDPDAFWAINGVKDLNREQQKIVKALYVFRDQQAKRQDRPLFKVFADRTIMELALAAPKYVDQLPAIHGMSKGQIRRYGRQIVRIIGEAPRDPVPKKPSNNSQRPPEPVARRYEKLRNWRKTRAQARGVESDVILSRGTLWDLARINPRSADDLGNVNSLGPWRREMYGEELLRVLRPR